MCASLICFGEYFLINMVTCQAMLGPAAGVSACNTKRRDHGPLASAGGPSISEECRPKTQPKPDRATSPCPGEGCRPEHNYLKWFIHAQCTHKTTWISVPRPSVHHCFVQAKCTLRHEIYSVSLSHCKILSCTAPRCTLKTFSNKEPTLSVHNSLGEDKCTLMYVRNRVCKLKVQYCVLHGPVYIHAF